MCIREATQPKLERSHAVDTRLLRSWAPAVFVGVLAGATVSGFMTGGALTAVFAVVALLVAANMSFRPEGTVLSERLPRAGVQHVVAFFIGAVSAMMGIGGGTLSVPILGAFSYPIRRAVGTASAIGLIIAVPGAAGFVLTGLDVPARPPASLGYVNLLGLALIVPATVVTAPLGAKIAHAIDPSLLRKAFALFLLLTSLRMLYGLLG